ncbi:Zn-dependent protease with chaperone function [Oikeobacillus pervagus]|uniref:Zn-dependent protease with chaperone function n=1 Tax=Oikeobacillus pervagus TaxID=1325931 RepID=A0AAJ1SXT1_9BACI|nr:M48 family metallopeptidase [Oikeobacillus pervagus]MDQ0214778.1 Zn-dependent protease with chaperone function [Oikeobacillus pervagus]
MLRKWSILAFVAYLILGLVIYYYLFIFADSTVPDIYKGTSADPTTFMNAKELMLSEEYSKIRNLLYFLSTPYEWLIYFFILIFGVSRAFEKWANQTSRFRIIQNAVYLFWLSMLSFALVFPIQYVSYDLSKTYQISTQTFPQWMKDEMIDFWVNYGTMLIIVTVLYAMMRKFPKKWWLAAWGLFVPFTIFMMYIQPIWIDPLYNDFYPLKDKELEAKILHLAEQANIPAEHVYEVNMSEKTNALNAYVTGVGNHSRIVLWDTTLERLSDDEILFVMAHEMGHYVEKHIYFGVAGYLLLSLFGFWLISKWLNRTIEKYGKEFKVTKSSQISSLPLFLLMVSILLFISSPITNGVSRYQETRADDYAMEITRDKEAAIQTFQKLTKAGLSQVNPPFLVKIFRYEHPTMLERLNMVETYPLKKVDPSKKEQPSS